MAVAVPGDGRVQGMQASMFRLELRDGQGRLRTVMVKRVVPRELPPKASPAAWRVVIASVRTEIQFYRELGRPEHAPIRGLFPVVHHSCGTAEALDTTSPMETAFAIVMQDLGKDYFQRAMMEVDEARLVLDRLAALHSHHWGQVAGLPRGGFWVLELRRAEVAGGDSAWGELLARFPDLEKIHNEVGRVGAVLQERAEELDRFVEEGAVTRIHGDAKGWNFFFGKPSAPSPFLFIDMQWTGRGHPLQVPPEIQLYRNMQIPKIQKVQIIWSNQDVAYALTTTLSEAALPAMESLVDHYVQQLADALAVRGVALDTVRLRGEYDKVQGFVKCLVYSVQLLHGCKCSGLAGLRPGHRVWTLEETQPGEHCEEQRQGRKNYLFK
jgi:hypothetical protein